jgi:hypothetical protein
VGVALAENAGKAKLKHLETDLKAGIAQPDLLVYDEGSQRLAQNFSNRSSSVLSVTVDSEEQAVATVEPVIQTDYQRFLFLCTTKKAYLTVCNELAMSRRDFFRFAELKQILQEENRIASDGVIGSAHKLIRTIKDGKLQFPFWNRVNKSGLQNLMTDIADADKFFITEDKWDPINDDLFYPGDYRLPFGKCLFEYEYEGKVAGEEALRKTKTYLLAYDYGGVYNGYLIDYTPWTKTFLYLGYGPRWTVDEAGNLLDQSVVEIDPAVSEFYNGFELENGESIMENRAYSALRRIGPTLAAMNAAHANIVTFSAPHKLQMRRVDEIPFFDYKKVIIDHVLDDDGNPVRGNAIQGRAGVALHKVRGHLKPTLDRWISPYIRGDARFGVVHKSFGSNDSPSGRD